MSINLDNHLRIVNQTYLTWKRRYITYIVPSENVFAQVNPQHSVLTNYVYRTGSSFSTVIADNKPELKYGWGVGYCVNNNQDTVWSGIFNSFQEAFEAAYHKYKDYTHYVEWIQYAIHNGLNHDFVKSSSESHKSEQLTEKENDKRFLSKLLQLCEARCEARGGSLDLHKDNLLIRLLDDINAQGALLQKHLDGERSNACHGFRGMREALFELTKITKEFFGDNTGYLGSFLEVCAVEKLTEHSRFSLKDLLVLYFTNWCVIEKDGEELIVPTIDANTHSKKYYDDRNGWCFSYDAKEKILFEDKIWEDRFFSNEAAFQAAYDKYWYMHPLQEWKDYAKNHYNILEENIKFIDAH